MADIRTSTTTVTVGCKLPNGLIMELAEPAAGRQLIPAPIGERHTLNGSNSTLIDSPFGRVAQGTHRYGITHVPKEFAEAWFARHKDFEFVKRGQVFIVKDAAAAASEAKLRENDSATRTGLEALVDKDPRLPKSVGKRREEPEAA